MKIFLLASFLCLFYTIHAAIQCNNRMMDLVIVLDESGSIGAKDFELAKDSLVNMLNKLNIAPGQIHIGVVAYGSTPRTILSLSNYQDKNAILSTIRNIKYLGGMTATGDAITAAHNMFKSNDRGLVPKISIVLTDGYSNHGVQNIYKAAAAMKKR